MMSKQIIHTNAAPAAVGPYSQAVAAPTGKMVFLSGQIGLVPETGLMVSDSFEAQVRQSFANMKAVIEAAGGRLENIVKLTLFLTDLKQFPVANSIMAELIHILFVRMITQS
jgi:reactive intermediate/imine deaminase